LTVTRATNYYVLKVLVPNILFTYLAFTVFWFDVRSGERLSFGITILLAMVAVDIISSELLPICPEYLFIDVMVAVSILFAFLALVETCLVVYWYYKNDANEAEDNKALLAMNKAVAAMTGVFKREREGDNDEGLDTPATINADEPEDDQDLGEDGDVFMDCEDCGEGEATSAAPALRNRRQKMSRMASFRSSFSKKKSVSFAKKQETRKAYLAERNLQEEYLLMGRKLDKFARWFFMIAYTLFLVIMFATIPLWQ